MSASIVVSELFTSIQGEGASAGTPSVFVRLQGCSVGCTWCDSKYTWSPEGTTWPLDDVVQYVRDAGLRNVVITGGEPLENSGFVPLAHALKDEGLRLEVETAGTIPPPPVAIDQWNVSLKLAHSGVAEDIRLRPRAIAEFTRLGAWFKFVVNSESDIDEVLGCLKRFSLPRERVMLMPLGLTAAEQGARMEMVAGMCVRHGLRFSPRIHTLIWGAKRGV
jgi:organic radical activating enzyme